MVACIYSLVVVLLINLLVRLLLGEVWVANWSNLDLALHLGMVAAALLIFTLYVLLGASLIYALPLAFLQDDPLVPSLVRSLKASRHFVVALLVLLGLPHALPLGRDRLHAFPVGKLLGDVHSQCRHLAGGGHESLLQL